MFKYWEFIRKFWIFSYKELKLKPNYFRFLLKLAISSVNMFDQEIVRNVNKNENLMKFAGK